jgi:NADPH2:quinone reductase
MQTAEKAGYDAALVRGDGLSRRRVSMVPLAAGALFAGNVSVGGFSIRGYAAKAPRVVAAALADVLERLSEGVLSIEPVVVDGLEYAAEAQQALAEGRGAGKYVVRV